MVQNAPAPAPDPRIPVTVLTGFFGAGKTTLLSRILSAQHRKRVVVIEDGYGEIGIDHALVISADEEIFEMKNGCICRTVRENLTDEDNMALRPEQERECARRPSARLGVRSSASASSRVVPGRAGATTSPWSRPPSPSCARGNAAGAAGAPEKSLPPRPPPSLPAMRRLLQPALMRYGARGPWCRTCFGQPQTT